MTQEAGTPKDFWDRVQEAAEKAVNRYIRAGLLNSASISSGGLTIKGGFLRLMSAVVGGVETFYAGPITPALPDGSYQPGMIVRRNDGTVVLQLWDPIPSVGDYNQFLAWYDRSGNIVFSDDTDSGLGHARPWLYHTMAAARYGDFRHSTTSPTFETVSSVWVNKQQPKLEVNVKASMDTSGTTGEVRVLVNGAQLGPVNAEAFAVSTRYYGPDFISGNYGDDVLVELQGRVTSGTGALKLESRFCRSRQS